jgi:hypothetical protein
MSPADFEEALRSSDLPLEGNILFAAAQQNERFIPKLRTGRIDIEKLRQPTSGWQPFW